jgi:hypothetical protein
MDALTNGTYKILLIDGSADERALTRPVDDGPVTVEPWKNAPTQIVGFADFE